MRSPTDHQFEARSWPAFHHVIAVLVPQAALRPATPPAHGHRLPAPPSEPAGALSCLHPTRVLPRLLATGAPSVQRPLRLNWLRMQLPGRPWHHAGAINKKGLHFWRRCAVWRNLGWLSGLIAPTSYAPARKGCNFYALRPTARPSPLQQDGVGGRAPAEGARRGGRG